MNNTLKRLLSTMLVVASVTGFSACQMQVADKPLNVTETQGDEGESTIESSENMVETSQYETEETTTYVEEETQEQVKTEEQIKEELIAKHYSSKEQVMAIADGLGVRSEIIDGGGADWKTGKKTILRLEHNMGKPIRVAIHPELSEMASRVAVEQVDMLFGYLSGINGNYTYEIVEYSEDEEYDILFQNRDGAFNGIVGFSEKSSHLGNIYVNKAEIYLNERAIDNSSYDDESHYRYVALHELMHVLGFEDVYIYDINQLDLTTILSSPSVYNNSYTSSHITPNDYKNLIALYAQPSENLSEDIERYQQMADEYFKEYYRQWAISNFENETMPSQSIENGVYSFTKLAYIDIDNKIRDELTFNLEVSGNNYTLTVFNSSGQVMETSSGNVKYMSVNGENAEVSNAIAIIENLNSKYIHEDIMRNAKFDTAYANIALYNNGERFVLKSVMSSMNKAHPEYTPFEMDLNSGM